MPPRKASPAFLGLSCTVKETGCGEGCCCLPSRLPLHPVLQLQGQQNCCLGTPLVSPVKEQQTPRVRSWQALQLGSYDSKAKASVPQHSLWLIEAISKGVPCSCQHSSQHQDMYKAAWNPCVKQRARQMGHFLPLPLLLREPCWQLAGKAGPLPLLQCQGQCRSQTWRTLCRC